MCYWKLPRNDFCKSEPRKYIQFVPFPSESNLRKGVSIFRSMRGWRHQRQSPARPERQSAAGQHAARHGLGGGGTSWYFQTRTILDNSQHGLAGVEFNNNGVLCVRPLSAYEYPAQAVTRTLCGAGRLPSNNVFSSHFSFISSTRICADRLVHAVIICPDGSQTAILFQLYTNHWNGTCSFVCK